MLTAHSIIAAAEAQCGISDSEATVRHNLERLIASFEQDFALSPEGETRVRGQLLMDAVNRLQGLKWVRDYPEILEEPIESPLFLTGLPRSGTTYFQYLFDRDDRFRLIRTTESVMPYPPPGFEPAADAGRRQAWLELQRSRGHSAEFEAMHLYDEAGSDECHAFLEQSYGAAGLNNLLRVPGYFDYLLDEADMAATYRIHKRQLQLLQWRRERKPWALKYPNHVLAMNEILQVYPDARFVMTHRDPVQVVASIAKMTHNLRSLRAGQSVDRHQVGRDMLSFIQRHIDRILDFDRSVNATRVVHVDYYALVADPASQMQSIHQSLGMDTPDAVLEKVRQWHRDNPKNARGRNDYSLDQFGLDETAVAAQFAEYRERFDIPREQEGISRASAL